MNFQMEELMQYTCSHKIKIKKKMKEYEQASGQKLFEKQTAVKKGKTFLEKWKELIKCKTKG